MTLEELSRLNVLVEERAETLAAIERLGKVEDKHVRIELSNGDGSWSELGVISRIGLLRLFTEYLREMEDEMRQRGLEIEAS